MRPIGAPLTELSSVTSVLVSVCVQVYGALAFAIIRAGQEKHKRAVASRDKGD